MKAPFKVLFNNDTSNIISCVSPHHAKDAPFRPETLEASVDETAKAGVDAHLLSPGVGWVPCWQSKVYPWDAHVRFIRERFGRDPSENSLVQYLANGGDILDDFVAYCRQRGVAPFVSLRLNDPHGHELTAMPPEEIPDHAWRYPGWAWHVLTPHLIEHPQWRLSQDLSDWPGRVLNWAVPEVRAQKLALITEITEQYDIEGFELDFMRQCNFFRQGETTSSQRRNIMTDFVKQVRAALDRTAGRGRHRWLGVRVPCYLGVYDSLGLDLRSLVSAGVDMVNLSAHYYTIQQNDMAALRQIAPEASVYLELCHCTRTGPPVDTGAVYDIYPYRFTTPTQYYTAAHLAYARALDGISLFNFVYYREHGALEPGLACEPPFHVLGRLGDPEWLAAQPQHYVLSDAWTFVNDHPPLPRTRRGGESATFHFDMAPPSGGWQHGGRLRIQAEQSLGDSQWRAVLNGTELQETPDRSEPYENPYLSLLGTSAQHRAWVVPARALKEGENTVRIDMTKGQGAGVPVFVDFAIE